MARRESCVERLPPVAGKHARQRNGGGGAACRHVAEIEDAAACELGVRFARITAKLETVGAGCFSDHQEYDQRLARGKRQTAHQRIVRTRKHVRKMPARPHGTIRVKCKASKMGSRRVTRRRCNGDCARRQAVCGRPHGESRGSRSPSAAARRSPSHSSPPGSASEPATQAHTFSLLLLRILAAAQVAKGPIRPLRQSGPDDGAAVHVHD